MLDSVLSRGAGHVVAAPWRLGYHWTLDVTGSREPSQADTDRSMRDPRLTEQRNPRSQRIDHARAPGDRGPDQRRGPGVAAGGGRGAARHRPGPGAGRGRVPGRGAPDLRGGRHLGPARRAGRRRDAADVRHRPAMVQGIIAGGYAALVRAQEGAEDHPEDGAAAIDERQVGPTGLRPGHRHLGHHALRPRRPGPGPGAGRTYRLPAVHVSLAGARGRPTTWSSRPWWAPRSSPAPPA